MDPLWAAPAGVAGGFVSALVPVVNAEALAATGGALTPVAALVAVVALAAGQTLGKLVVYEAAARGTARHRPARSRVPRLARTASALLERYASATGSPLRQGLLTTTSAAVGLPPLAAVAVAAGAAGQSRTVFSLACFAGRVARFGAVLLGATSVVDALR